MWQCSKVDSNGVRCPVNAVCRLHFSIEHPFDFIDVCEAHYNEYTDWLWEQAIEELDQNERNYLNVNNTTPS